MQEIEVSIIFVNYKTSHLLNGILASIKEKSDFFSYEIIIVDNSCDPEEWEKLQAFKDVATLVDAEANLGFGKANNLGAKIAKGKYLYFLNTDTLLMNNAIYELKKFLDEHPKVSIVGSNLYSKDGKPNSSFIANEMNLKNEKKLNSLGMVLKRKMTGKRSDFNYRNCPTKVNGYVCGASLMMRSADFKLLGGFDKDIFMYAEETLLCYRTIHDLHKEIYNVPSSKIIHFEGESFDGKISYRRIKAYIDGNVVYHEKAFGKETAISYLRFIRRSGKTKRFLARLMRDEDKRRYFCFVVEASEEKMKELGK